MSAPHPAAIERAMSAAMQLRDALWGPDGGYTADDKLLLDMIEGETDVLEVLDRLIEASMADKVLAEMAAARARRFKARKDRLRDIALQMLEALGITRPLERAAYTASITHTTKTIVTNADLLPRELLRPDLDAITRALKDGPVAGATKSNPQPHIKVVP